MGIIKNKYVNRFISGGNTPAFPPSPAPGEAVTTELPAEAQSLIASQARPPPGWFIQWEPNAQKIYYLEQATGRTQWVRPNMPNASISRNVYRDDDEASILSGTTVHPSNSRSVYRDSDEASILRGTTVHATKPGNKLHRALQWRALPPQPNRQPHNHPYLNLPTKAEREEILREAAEKRKKEGPPKYVH
jgi:hypothetical protein